MNSSNSSTKDGDQDYKRSLIEEFESDVTEEATAGLEQMLLATQQVHRPNFSELILKLESSDGWFPVSDVSCYRDSVWRLDGPLHSTRISIPFDSQVYGGNELKRALSYYMLPENSLMGGVKSNRTSMVYSQDFGLVEKYLLVDNNLDASPNGLRLVSSRLVDQALDKIRDQDTASNYFGFYKIMKLWVLLSDQHLIPEHLRIDIPLDKVDVLERRKEIADSIKATLSTWVAFSEEDLGHLMEYALFWLEKVPPELKKIVPAINKLNSNSTRRRKVITNRDEALEKSFCVVIDGKKVMELNCAKQVHKKRADQFRYTWKANYAAALDQMRSALLILFALVTGARASELAPLSITDISNDKADGSGNYWLRIVRWKTADDPTYNGEIEYLPLPRFAAECAITYHDLGNVGRSSKRHWLFQSNRSDNTKTSLTPQMLSGIIQQLTEDLPVERIHLHRFRKTIAEILINQDERNLDLIRALFGHKTFKMTMQYIARNPAMVRAVAASIEHSYTSELHDVITQIKYGAYSGLVAQRINQQIQEKPADFEVGQLKISLLDFVSNLLVGGEPLFIRRTAVGTYCVTAEQFDLNNLPPCIQGRDFGGEIPRPDPTNCHYECRKIVVLEKARDSLEGNIKFYQRILDKTGANLPDRTRRDIEAKVASYHEHLKNLNATSLGRHNTDFVEVSAQQKVGPLRLVTTREI
ncbi:tyrosine-type recombinase/integrase [Pseudomonas coleopterorum]|uniref:Tyrosine-type recombinase/integrase n=1 Tax=Pseudomonas coleopterorum TaxID=1605838 RepID=A0ABR9C3D5_9PSED|nr:tyrosine-type recombinase/integrase [Pseudomonas coleopterorum]MBD8755655.1 tyrosine-type recombinase/integrase [Pseudomonas coleopterorum]MBD8771635.1 tyrosine-type recombinase/integrase [Pseudomonas coleopterorum]